MSSIIKIHEPGESNKMIIKSKTKQFELLENFEELEYVDLHDTMKSVGWRQNLFGDET